ncbi:hypothetical protein, partial [Caballeronia sp. BR00000012568055]|uniref:hypothetical protein n=1 Tax=Caballeronia sp. BR00000012568055 TaxID=2918761 RepID=UPI0023F8AAD8
MYSLVGYNQKALRKEVQSNSSFRPLLLQMLTQLDEIAHLFCVKESQSTAGTPEAIFCYDLKTGNPLGRALGTIDGVFLPRDAVSAGRDPLRDVKVVHSHPNSLSHVSLSDA